MAGDTVVYILDGPDDYKIAKRRQFDDAEAASWYATGLAQAGVTAWTE